MTAATQFLTLATGIPRLQSFGLTPAVYNQELAVVATISAGTPVTLPSGGTYTGAELQIFLNGQTLDVTLDYFYYGSGARTQVTFNYDLVPGDNVRFRTDRYSAV